MPVAAAAVIYDGVSGLRCTIGLPAFFSVFVVFTCLSIAIDFGTEFVPPEDCAANGPAIRTVTMRAAALVLNMAFSSLGPSQRDLRPRRSRP
jgi:hypothetical protein